MGHVGTSNLKTARASEVRQTANQRDVSGMNTVDPLNSQEVEDRGLYRGSMA
jgi:hypothetical protein